MTEKNFSCPVTIPPQFGQYYLASSAAGRGAAAGPLIHQ